MNVRTLLVPIVGVAAFCWLLGQSPQPAQASLQTCNPTIATISGSSNVWGQVKNMTVRGPGQEVAGGAAPFVSIETVQGGGLDATSGMSYRGNGLWQDSQGNRLQLSIQATRTNDASGGISSTTPCAGSLSGPVSGYIGLPGGFGASSTQAEIIGDWCIINTQGFTSNQCAQHFGLRAVVAINVVPQPSSPPPVTPPASAGAPSLSVSGPTCQGSTAVFTLTWTQIPTNGYRLYYNGAPSNPALPATANSTTVGLAPGSSATVQINAINSQNEVPSNPVTISADPQACASAPPPATPPPVLPAAPGPFSVRAVATCLPSNAAVQITLTWDAASNASRYSLIAVHNGSGSPLASTAALSHTYTEPAGTWNTRYYNLYAINNNNGVTFATPGSGTISAAPEGSWNRFGVVLPSCAPTPPGAFTATIDARCSGVNPIGRLDWTAASGATSYRIFDTGTPGATAQLGTISSSDPRSFDVSLTRANPSFTIDALNAGGVSSATITAQLPDCTPDPSIALAAINSACSAGSPSNLLSWTSDNGSGGTLSDFAVLRDGTSIGTATSTTFTDTTATQGSSYSYTVQSGTTTSNAQSITTATCPQPPGALSLTVAAGCLGTSPVNQLSWTASSAATRYQVLRDGNTQPLTTINAPTVTYTDSAVAAGESHGYIIRALNDVGSRDSASQQVTTLNCTPAVVNNPPIANDDNATTGPATPVTIAVLANDSDPDGNLDPTTVRITQNPSNGSATVSSGSIVYTPNTGFAGIDTLTYEVCDTTALCDTAIVTITVTAAPPPPPPILPGPLTLSPQALCVGQAPQHILTWTAATDTDIYVVKRNGVVVTTTTTTNYIDTTVVAGNTYNYTVDATNSAGATASNSVSTSAPTNCIPPANNLPPIANDDTAATEQDSFVVIPVLTNDSDPDGQVVPSCTRVITQPGHGTTVVDSTSGAIAYTPTPGFSGTDTFVYEICDDKGATDTATVTITVRPPAPTKPNSPPQANDDTATTPHNTPVDVDILLNDSDPDGDLDPTCVKVIRQPGHGTVAINATNGRASYTPTNGFAGTDSFQYTVCDKTKAVSNTATVSIAVGQAPPAALASTGIPIFGFFVDLWNRLLTLIGLR
ncbi:MAG: Ig-like domain-containing protein [Patescibacteria group bacterium]